jgi:hypothetical protein
MRNKTALDRLRRDNRAISPAISTTIITSAIISMLLVTVLFANNYLNARMAENEFSSMKQFMQTIGLQIDDVAWTVGRTQTIRYASKFGQVSFQNATLNYSLYVNNMWIANFTTGALMFNMPTDKYTIANSYSELIFPSSNSSFLQQGTSAPVSHVFLIERVPMKDGSYIRVVATPSIRRLNSTISTGNATSYYNYYNYYLPILTTQPGNNSHLSQSVTIAATSVKIQTIKNANNINITLDFPKSTLGFDSGFFNFDSTNYYENLNGGTVEFYTGDVTVSLGLYS